MVSIFFFLVGFRTSCLKEGHTARISFSFRSFLSPAMKKLALGCNIFNLLTVVVIWSISKLFFFEFGGE